MATATKKKAKKKAKKKLTAKNRLPSDNGSGNGSGAATEATEKKRKKGEKLKKQLTISAPNFETAEFTIRGDAPYVMNKFGAKARAMMHDTQARGSTSSKGKKRDPKDFQGLYEESQHREEHKGWIGLPATAFRNAMISACKLCGFAMTRAKCTLFVEADGYGEDGTPLVKLNGKPEYFELPVRQQMTCDLRVRAKFQIGWTATLRVRYDADQFTIEDVGNLLVRVGMQVGVGEGRPDSKNSAGMGRGLFSIVR